MFEETNQSRLLKNVPAIIVRALPAIYYFSRFIKDSKAEKPVRIFQGCAQFLSLALQLLGEKLQKDSFIKIAFQARLLMDTGKDELLPILDEIIIKLAEHFDEDRDVIRGAMKILRNGLLENYKEMVPPLHILVNDINNEEEHVETVAGRLTNFCHYKVATSTTNEPGHQQKILQSDFVVFASTTPESIHQEIARLRDFNKPLIALATIESEGQLNKNAIRHATQLMRVGYEVLFKVFTPIRLYTSIERNYMKFHLCPPGK